MDRIKGRCRTVGATAGPRRRGYRPDLPACRSRLRHHSALRQPQRGPAVAPTVRGLPNQVRRRENAGAQQLGTGCRVGILRLRT